MSITSREITKENFKEVIALSTTLPAYQQKCVASNVYSLVGAYVHKDKLVPKAIYLEKKCIGFIMFSVADPSIQAEGQPVYFIWRFMIAKDYQNKGYGRKALDLLVNICRKDGIKTLYTSCDISGREPYSFYINYGFIDILENDGEQILKLYV